MNFSCNKFTYYIEIVLENIFIPVNRDNACIRNGSFVFIFTIIGDIYIHIYTYIYIFLELKLYIKLVK